MNEPIHVQVQGDPPRRGGGALLFLPGLAFLALGVLVIFVPQVLIAMVAGAFFLIGLGLIFGALALGRARKRLSHFANFGFFRR